MPEVQEQKKSAGEKGKILPLNTFLTRLIWYCVLPLAAISFWLAFDHVRTLQDQRDREAERLSRHAVAVIDSHLEARIAALEILAGSVLIENPKDRPRFYQRAMGYHDKFAGHVILADTSGKMLLNTRVPFGSQLPDLPKVEGRAAAPETLRTGKPAVGDMFIGPVAGKPLIAIAVPVIRSGQTKYLLLETIEASHIGDHLKAISLPDGWSLSATDGKDATMARSGSSMKEGAATKSDTRKFQSKSNVSQWSVILEIPRGIYMAPVYTSSATFVMAILIALVVGVLGGRLAGRRLSREVKVLTDCTSQSAQGLKIEEIDAARSVLNNAYAELREKELQYRNLANSGLALIWTSGPDKLCNYFNEPWLKFTGRTMEHEMGNGWTEGVHPDDLDRCIEIYMSAFDRHDPFDMEYRLRHASGEYRWIRDMGTPNFNSEGEFTGYIGHCFDVTEHRKADEELREREALIRTISNNLPSGMIYQIVVRNDGTRKLTYCSDSVKQLHGITPEAAMADASLIHKTVDENDIESLRKAEDEAIKTLSTFRTEARIKSPSGETKWSYFSSTPTLMEDGSTCWNGIELDITEFKKAEDELRHSEKQLKEVQEMAHLGYWSWDVKTGVVEWSDEVYKIFRLNPKKFTPKIDSILALSPWPEDHERDRELIRRAMESREKGDYEQRFLRPDKSVGYYYSTFQGHYNEQGELIAIVGSVIDITERKKSEAELHDKIDELERYQRLTVGRELAMIELKKEVNELLIKYGLEAKYRIVE
jgi:PAS domain S-box-containing protein